MKVLSIQSSALIISGRAYPDKSRCNHPHALPVYQRLFGDYNEKKGTSYESFFWGFSELRTNDLDVATTRALEMIGMLDAENCKVLILDVPDEICLETDFYNFSDEIFAYQYPDELQSHWDCIYDNRNSEKQIIFPYIEESWVIAEVEIN